MITRRETIAGLLSLAGLGLVPGALEAAPPRKRRREKRKRIAEGRDWVRRYDWSETARSTLSLYQRAYQGRQAQ